MRILVTGASGFVGSALVEALAKAGHSGTAVSRREMHSVPKGWRWFERSIVLGSRDEWDPEVIIHLEVKQHVQDPTPADEALFTEVNVEGTARWLQWAASKGVRRFILLSSIKASGECVTCRNESDESLPDTPYGRSKLAAEQIVRKWVEEHPMRSAMILRSAVVYGPRNGANMFSFIDAIARRRFFLMGRNDNIKSMISLRNLVAAINYLLTHPTAGASLFYLTDRKSFSVAQLASMVSDALDRKNTPFTIPLPLARLMALAGDAIASLTGKDFPLTSNRLNALMETSHFSSEKLVQTGFVHPQSTQDGLKEMVAWYLSSGRD